MIAQLFLTALLGIVLVYAWSAYRMAPAVGLMAVAMAAAGLYFVWMPAHATALARFVGVGRGVDLILYCWVVISLLMLLNLHLKLRAQMELITRLARNSAIAEAGDEARATAAPPAAPGLQPGQAEAGVPDRAPAGS
jgi:small membrane protein